MDCFCLRPGTTDSQRPLTYVGWTNDIDKRLARHNAGKGARSTRGRAWKPAVFRTLRNPQRRREPRMVPQARPRISARNWRKKCALLPTDALALVQISIAGQRIHQASSPAIKSAASISPRRRRRPFGSQTFLVFESWVCTVGEEALSFPPPDLHRQASRIKV